MMEKVRVAFLFFLTACSSASIGDRYEVLEKEHAKAMLSQCSRYAPPYEGEWAPSTNDIKKLEKYLYLLKEQEATLCCSRGKMPWDPLAYERQYVGIVLNGRRVIYINAFHLLPYESGGRPVIVCDGGKAHWGAIFDPNINEFSQLSFNGEA